MDKLRIAHFPTPYPCFALSDKEVYLPVGGDQFTGFPFTSEDSKRPSVQSLGSGTKVYDSSDVCDYERHADYSVHVTPTRLVHHTVSTGRTLQFQAGLPGSIAPFKLFGSTADGLVGLCSLDFVDKKIFLVDMKTGNAMLVESSREGLVHAWMNGSGSLLATMTCDSGFRLYRVVRSLQGIELTPFKGGVLKPVSVLSVTFMNEKSLCVQCSSGTVELYEANLDQMSWALCGQAELMIPFAGLLQKYIPSKNLLVFVCDASAEEVKSRGTWHSPAIPLYTPLPLFDFVNVLVVPRLSSPDLGCYSKMMISEDGSRLASLDVEHVGDGEEEVTFVASLSIYALPDDLSTAWAGKTWWGEAKRAGQPSPI